MTRPHLRTARIELVPMTIEHLPLLIDLDADAQVLRFIVGRAREPAEAEAHWRPVCADTGPDAVGLGWWIGQRRTDQAFLGWWALSPDRPVTGRPTRAEAGWRLARRHWRQGYGTEAHGRSSTTGSPTPGSRPSGRRRWRSTRRAGS